MRAVAAIFLCAAGAGLSAAAACGGRQPAVVDAGSPDAPSADGGMADAAAQADASERCGITWTLVPGTIEAVTSMEAVAIHTARTARFRIDAWISGCARPAMTRVNVDEAAQVVSLQVRAWQQTDDPCAQPPQPVVRYVSLVLPTPGLWTVGDGVTIGVATTVDVGAPPPTPCGSFPCLMDCDCPAGRCLSGTGIGGPFTACAEPCEHDMDCSHGLCQSPDDGLESACVNGDQCGGGLPGCPAGHVCNAGSCEPDYILSAATRVPCGCDDDCAFPLSCVEPEVLDHKSPPGERRCEMTCRTSSARWCAGPHFCGEREQDVSGLADADSVCVFAGE